MNPDQVRQYLSFYQDLGVKNIYRRKASEAAKAAEPLAAGVVAASAAGAAKPAKTPAKPAPWAIEPGAVAPPTLIKPATKPQIVVPELIPLAPTGDTLLQISADIGDCHRCGLSKARSKIVFGSGNERAQLVFVGEGPGADEDAQGLPFVGRAGQLLTQMIDGTAAQEGIPIHRSDVYICNVVKCRPPENRTPLPDEMEICGEFLFRQLMAIQPKAICALGSTAAKALLATKDGVTRLRGKWHKWRDIPVIVTFHPSYLLRPYNQDAKREAWEDLKRVLHFVYD